MIKQISRALVSLFGVFAILYGVYAIYEAQSIVAYYRSSYSMSAVQETQVYSMGTYWGAQACAAFLLALCCIVGETRMVNSPQ